jgi:DNA polymerase-1
MEGFEADDIIGTLAKRGEAAGYDVWCVTGDKDYFQLVTDRVHVYIPRKSTETPERIGREEVKAKFGVYPEQVIDKLSLMGDSSDNVPGVPGVGPVAADKLLAEFGSLDEILAQTDRIKAKGVREKVESNVELAKLSRELVTIHTSVPVKCEFDQLKRRPIDYDAARKLFLELEFKGLLNQLAEGKAEPAQADLLTDTRRSEHYVTVTSLNNLEQLVQEWSHLKEIAVDTETTSLNPFEAKLVSVSISTGAGQAYYVPIDHSTNSDKNLPRDKALKLLAKVLENRAVQKAGQNIKYDYEVLRRAGIEIDPISFDSMVASYVIDPSSRQHSLDYMALKYFDHRMQPITDLIGSGKNQKTFDTVSIADATYYSCEDADYTYRLRGVLAPKIDELKLNSLYYDIELPLIKVLSSMEREGVRIDVTFLSLLSDQMQKKSEDLTGRIYEIAGMQFNINSTQQLSHILFEKLSLPTKGKTAKKTGYSTDVSVLEELSKIHEFPSLILQFRQVQKLKSTYVDALPRMVNPETGRVHTSFNQTIAATGRLSSTDPNLQNIPIRTEDGKEIRKAFVPRDKDHVLLAADYSQIELRILAHYSSDKGLIEAFKRNEDVHARTAAEVFGVDIAEVTPAQRRVAKTCNFAIIYGVTAYGLTQQTDLTVEQAKQFIDTYFARYPGINSYIEETKKTARSEGYVTTLFNRRRYLPEINDKNFSVRQFAERTAINTPIQGTAADIIKIAMIDIDKKLARHKSRMVLQVHDELVFDVHKDELDDVKKIVADGMEKAAKLKVPLVADIGVADNWLDAK